MECNLFSAKGNEAALTRHKFGAAHGRQLVSVEQEVLVMKKHEMQ